ncbi:MAG: tetratricopeptide repeat protein [Bacteroidetes bacterium]|nr:tetratricopeptide repeat protein [Bacteroidota bacterium]
MVAVGAARGQSIEEVQARAEQGDAEAQYELGKAYSVGEGVPQNSTEAVRWYRKAAEQGHPLAQYELGKAYHNGEDVP